MRKLVRDRVPALMRSEGIIPALSVLTFSEYKQALVDKLVEEAFEVKGAYQNTANSERFYEELGDLAEVLNTLLKLCGSETIADMAKEKRDKKGSFECRLAVEWSDDGALIGNDTGTFIPKT